LEDYEKSILAGVMESRKSPSTNKLKLYDNQKDLHELRIQVSSHPLMTYRLIRRFVLQLQDLERDLGNQNEKSKECVLTKLNQ